MSERHPYAGPNTMTPGETAENDPMSEKSYCPNCEEHVETFPDSDECVNCMERV